MRKVLQIDCVIFPRRSRVFHADLWLCSPQDGIFFYYGLRKRTQDWLFSKPRFGAGSSTFSFVRYLKFYQKEVRIKINKNILLYDLEQTILTGSCFTGFHTPILQFHNHWWLLYLVALRFKWYSLHFATQIHYNQWKAPALANIFLIAIIQLSYQ